MTAEITPFFSDLKNNVLLGNFLEKFNALESKDLAMELCVMIVRDIAQDAIKYDENCFFNIKENGSNFIACLVAHPLNFPTNSSSTLKILLDGYKFLMERDFVATDESGRSIRGLLDYIDKNIVGFDATFQSGINYARFAMPVQIAKRLVNHKNVDSIKYFLEKSTDIEVLKGKWDSDLTRREERVNALVARMESTETSYAFIGLNQAFEKLLGIKKGELNSLFLYLSFIGVVIITPLLAEFIYVLRNLDTIPKQASGFVYAVPSMVACELLLIYFFRVVLSNFQSTKAQLLQLELRKALCEFIQSYSSYAKEIKTNDNTSLDKFESLIFSGLVSSDKDLPTTFDGLEQIANFMKSVKK